VIKRIDENGVEYWTARELFPLLGYSRWEKFDDVIARAAQAALQSGQRVDDHFHQAVKMIDIGKGGKRAAKDWKLDRYACYLIAQNGDSGIPQIALAQTYFAVQTRRQEVLDQLPDLEKRLFIRGEVSSQNKKLFKTAKASGVTNFGLFNDAGYKGLYNASLADIEKRKGIMKGELLDRAGSTELAANLFRITQTDDKLKNDKVSSEQRAKDTHFTVGRKVRRTIQDIGGIMPENLKPEKHIREVKKEIRLIDKQAKKALRGGEKKLN